MGTDNYMLPFSGNASRISWVLTKYDLFPHEMDLNTEYFSYLFWQLDPNANPIGLIRISVLMFWSLTIVFIACESGERMSLKFKRFNYALGQCNWYAFPIEMQQMFVTIMASSQSPTFIEAYGNILCTRESFKNVEFFHLFFNYWWIYLDQMNFISQLISFKFYISDCSCWLLIFYDVSSNRCINTPNPNIYSWCALNTRKQ